MVTAREYDSGDAVHPCSLKHVVGTSDVVPQYLWKLAFLGLFCEMNDCVGLNRRSHNAVPIAKVSVDRLGVYLSDPGGSKSTMRTL